ncbi:MAG: hypothetical protein ACE5HX_13805, partial [bacterium]
MISRNKKQKVTSSARVAFFVSRYDIGSSSSIINSAIMLAQSGYHVDIFLYQVSNPHWVKFGNERICIHDLSDVPKTSFNFSAKLRHAIKMVLRFFLPLKTRDRLRRLFKRDLKHKIASGSIRDPEFAIIPESVLNAAEAVMRGKHYQCFFGMESEGLIFAGWLATKFNVPVLYFS